MPTVVVAQRNQVPAPFTYTLSDIQTFRPESVFASWDGTGASGPFLACLTFKSDSGNVFSRTFPSSAVPAGGSADVSYAPFPGGMIAGSVADVTSNDGSVVITNPNGPAVDLAVITPFDLSYDTITVPAGGAATEVTFNWSNHHVTTGVWDYTTPTNPKAKRSGLLIVTFDVQVDGATPMTAGSFFEASVQCPGPTASFPNVLIVEDKKEATAALPAPRLQMCGAKHMDSGDGISLIVANFDVNPFNCDVFVRSCVVGGNDV